MSWVGEAFVKHSEIWRVINASDWARLYDHIRAICLKCKQLTTFVAPVPTVFSDFYWSGLQYCLYSFIFFDLNATE